MDVQPICLPLRRILFNLRDRLTKKLKDSESLSVIEKVEGPSNWVSPVIIVPKLENNIRLCVDMCRANTAISRVRYPIPTIDEILHDLNQSKVFSKLGMKWAYHQIELEPNSRDIRLLSRITVYITINV